MTGYALTSTNTNPGGSSFTLTYNDGTETITVGEVYRNALGSWTSVAYDGKIRFWNSKPRAGHHLQQRWDARPKA